MYEFQDTNIFQYNIFKLIKEQGPITFFMVGDERQSIYRFAGAINNSFEIAEIDFKTSHQNLPITYRSTDNIVEAYCSLFYNHPRIINKSEHKNLGISVFVQRS